MGTIECRLRNVIKRKELAENRDITYTEIAERTGLRISTISDLVNNETSRYYASTLAILCGYFGCQAGDLLVYVPDESTDASERSDTDVAGS